MSAGKRKRGTAGKPKLNTERPKIRYFERVGGGEGGGEYAFHSNDSVSFRAIYGSVEAY